MSQQVELLKKWYEDQAKRFVSAHLPARAADFEAAVGRIEAHDRRVREELAICFLGDSGIGKSTLINALVAGKEMVLPSGGIGPLTALAMEVRYGTEASFEAEYHASNRLRQLIFGLEKGFSAQLKDETGKVIESNPIDLQIESEEVASLEETDSSSENEDPDRRTRLESYRKQAQLMVKGNQDTDCELIYLLDCVREAVGSKREWGTSLLADDESRILRLKAAISMGKDKRSHRVTVSSAPGAFNDDLHDHATGFLAPLIKTLQVTWPSPLLEDGIVLVDLPGVGVAGDVYKDVTRKWIFERAKAVVLVVGRAGVTEVAVDLLRTSDFLTRMLFSRDDSSHDPVVLAVAMSHLDDVAQDAWVKDKSKKKAQHLEEEFERARGLIRSHLRQVLTRVWESGDEKVRAGQQEVIDTLVQEARICPVSAPEYRRCLEQNDDDRAFISDPKQSGIPAMQEALLETVRARRREATLARNEATKALLDQITTSAQLIREQWSGSGHTDEEMKRLESDLESFMAPLRKEFLVRQGQFREYLKSTMPERIGVLVGKAKESARGEINRYTSSLNDVHWATLRAAIRRDGTFIGSGRARRHINLPDDLARMFVEPVAEVWGKAIIQEIRKRTREFAADCERMVVAISVWCRSQGTRVAPKLLEAQIEALRADVKQIDLAGKDVISSLREQVKNRLTNAVHKPIQRKCRQFVESGRDIGPGVKIRMMDEIVRRLEYEATDAAAEAAESLLLQCFRQVSEELRQVLKDLDDPLQNAADSIKAAHRGKLERTDAKHRESVLADVAQLLASKPQLQVVDR